MIVPYTITLTANTTANSKFVSDTLPNGFLKTIYVNIPANWGFAQGIQIYIDADGGNRIKEPRGNKYESYITGQGCLLPIEVNRWITRGDLKIYGINNNTTDNRTCGVLFEIATGLEITHTAMYNRETSALADKIDNLYQKLDKILERD